MVQWWLFLVVDRTTIMVEDDLERGAEQIVDDDDESEYDEEAEAEKRHEAEAKKKEEKAKLEKLDTICVFIAFIVIMAASVGLKRIHIF